MNHTALTRRNFVKSAVTASTMGAAAKNITAAPTADVRIGLYSITYAGLWYRGDPLTLEQVIGRAQKFGYQGIEIGGKRPHGNPLDMPKSRCRQLRDLADSQGIEIYSVAGNSDFSSPIPEHREVQLVYLRELMRMTSDLGVKILRVFLGWPGVTVIPEGGGSYEFAQAVWKTEHKDYSENQIWAWCREILAEAARYAGDFGVTLALQNHAPVITGYRDTLRMVKEVASPHLKVCFDARLEHSLSEVEVRKAVNEVGALQTIWHFGGEFDRDGHGNITLKGDEKMLGEALGLMDIGYRGFAGFELCHPLPVVNGKTVGLDFVDKNAQLAIEYMRGILAEARKQH